MVISRNQHVTQNLNFLNEIFLTQSVRQNLRIHKNCVIPRVHFWTILKCLWRNGLIPHQNFKIVIHIFCLRHLFHLSTYRCYLGRQKGASKICCAIRRIFGVFQICTTVGIESVSLSFDYAKETDLKIKGPLSYGRYDMAHMDLSKLFSYPSWLRLKSQISEIIMVPIFQNLSILQTRIRVRLDWTRIF